jgi:hypothetical protein
MSSAAEPTLSMVLPVIDGLKYLMQSSVGGLDVLRQLYVELLDEKFCNLFSDRDLCIATIVDPRLKTIPFENETHKTFAIESTVDAMTQIAITPRVNLSQRVTQALSAPLPAVPSTSQSAAAASARRPSLWENYEHTRLVAATIATESNALKLRDTGLSREAVRMQLMEYLRAPSIPRDSSPFQWLRQTSSQQEPPFPLVTRLARMMLSIPATSVSSERLFSKAGDVVTKKRNRLSPKNAENIVFLMDNAV